MNETTALAVQRPGASIALMPQPGEWQLMTQMATALFQSGLLPTAIKSPQAAVAVMQKGRELGIPPMQAMTGIVIIQGKPTCGAELALALVYRDHGDEAIRITTTTAEQCTITYRRRGWKSPETYTFSMEDAKRAELAGTPNWRKYPQAMLRARAISAVARMAFADSVGGMYSPDEMGAPVDVTDAGDIIVLDPAPTAQERQYDASTGERTTPTPLRQPRNPNHAAFGTAAELTRRAEADGAAAARGEGPPLKWHLNMAVTGCMAWNPKTGGSCHNGDLDVVNLAGWVPAGAHLCRQHADDVRAGGKLTVVNQPTADEAQPVTDGVFTEADDLPPMADDAPDADEPFG